jgi:hypothetical protein
MEAICEVFVQEDKKVVWFPNFFFLKKMKRNFINVLRKERELIL